MKAIFTLLVLVLAGRALAAQGAGACNMPPKFLLGARSEVLVFSFEWKGLPLAWGDLEFDCASEGGDGYHRIRASVITRPWISWLWSLDNVAESVVSPENFSPKHYSLVKKGGSDKRKISLTFDHVKKRALLSTTSDEGTKEKLIPFEMAYDPLALLYYMRITEISPGEAKTVELLTGKRRYSVSFTIGSKEAIEVGAGRFEAEKIKAKLIKLSSKGIKKGKARHAFLWLSADGRRLPLKFEIEASLGRIAGELTSFSLR